VAILEGAVDGVYGIAELRLGKVGVELAERGAGAVVANEPGFC
jgi:hypothetical protein